MDLKEFTKGVIQEISEAVEEVNQTSQRETILYTSQEKRTVEFDVAVTVEERDKGGGKGGIKVLGLVTAEGGGTKEVTSSTVSRIQFGVNISLRKKGESGLSVSQPNLTYNRGG
ncbi:MAG: hypothetical protein PHW95_00810 [Patescibacteria group bacterium]|nr:hypothetical protein [Patescibacteria group bacterium]